MGREQGGLEGQKRSNFDPSHAKTVIFCEKIIGITQPILFENDPAISLLMLMLIQI